MNWREHESIETPEDTTSAAVEGQNTLVRKTESEKAAPEKS